MIHRILCAVLGHRWWYQGSYSVLTPAICVSLPCVCFRCGKTRGIFGQRTPPHLWLRAPR